MIRTPKTSEHGVYKLEVEGRIMYRVGNRPDGAKENLRGELERKLGSSVLVSAIKILSNEKQ